MARACRIACKRNPDAADVPKPQAPLGSQSSVLPGIEITHKMKFVEVIDPKLDVDAVVFSPQQVQDAYNVYKARLGAYPMPHEKITAEQHSALSRSFSSGDSPYVDLGFFGVCGHRLLKLQGTRRTADGLL
eukprot:1681951-Amphidinium_carterae.1